MRFTATAVLLLVWMATASPANADADIASVVAAAKPSVVTVTTYDAAGKQIGLGTGFFVDESHIVTCYHVIDGATKAKIRSATGRTYQVKGIAASDRTADVVRLSLASPVKGAKSLSLAKSLPKQGEKVVVFGSPMGLALTVSDGIVSAIRDIPGVAKIIQITAPISPGSSGSPVLNLKGKVVGVVTSYLAEGQNLNFAVASEQVLSLKPSSSALPLSLAGKEPDPAQRELDLAHAHMFAGDYAKALTHFEAAITIKPEVAEAWCDMGYCYGQLGRYSEEVDACKHAIRIKLDTAEAHYNLGVAYANLGRCSDALDAFIQAVRTKPDDADAQHNLGVVYVQLQRNQEAVDAFKQAIRIKPDYSAAHLCLGCTYILLGDKGSALDEYKILKNLDADRASVLFNSIYK